MTEARASSALEASWRRELLWGTAASAVFALPGLVGQVALGRALGRVQDYASLLSLATDSGSQLWLQPLDAVLGGAVRLVVLAALLHGLLVLMVGRLSFRGTLAATGRAARALASLPLLAGVAVGLGAILWAVQPDLFSGPRWTLAYGAMRGWLALQATVWLWVLWRLGSLLATEHGLRGAEARFVAFAPAWALALVTLLDAGLP